jgi:hypothetical protein
LEPVTVPVPPKKVMLTLMREVFLRMWADTSRTKGTQVVRACDQLKKRFELVGPAVSD